MNQTLDSEPLEVSTRIAQVLQGRRNSGQRSLEIALRGCANFSEAQNALCRQLKTLIRRD